MEEIRQITHWLLVSMSEEIFPIISKCHGSEIWCMLEKEFISASNTQILHVRNLSHTTKIENH